MYFAFVLAGLLLGLVLLGRPRLLDPRRDADRDGSAASLRPVGSLIVIIPARNEASSLPRLLADLAAQHAPIRAIIVADDQSTDDTAALAAAGGATVVPVPPLPAGWMGKPWACESAVASLASEAGADDVLVFLDADVRLAPDAFDHLADRLRRDDVVSVQPFHEAESSREQFSVMFNIVSAMGIGLGTDHPNAVVGPLIACRSSLYRQVGGHGSVARCIAEDVALGARFVATGARVRVYAGGRSVRYRMYPGTWRDLLDGWTKNVATGAGSVPRRRSIAIALWVTALGAAIGTLSRVDLNATDPVERFGPAAVIVAAMLVMRSGARRAGSFRAWCWWLYPIVLAFFMAVFFRSVMATLVLRKVRWKDRSVPLAPEPVAVERAL
ncbi:MAG: glycosyltransferase [Actinobacteria bacterium]|nr:glycosyltransferase [Actinomycetota bacterium]